MHQETMPDKPCPRCGTPIPTEPGSGDSPVQCPRCLLRPAWDKPHPVAITLGPGQSFVPPTVEELSRHIVGYDVESIIGQGGMGAVYLGRQQSLDRRVAIKILPRQIAERPGFRERFGQEGRALAKLNHPNIVAIHDFGQAGPYAMLVMELVEGANLREVLAQGRLSPTEALEIIPQLCDALSYAHEEGVVHRDIKPENLLFDGRGRLKITDFGLAKLLTTKTTGEPGQPESEQEASPLPDPTQGVVGTVHYMAPEQLENPKSVDHRADLYALGVVFYEMLTGELPIGRFEPPSQLVNEDGADQPSKVVIDVRLDEVVLRALEKHPEKRYGSASAIMHDIDEIESQPHQSMAAKILPEEHRRRVRDTVHRAGEAASSFAASSIEATGDWASKTKKTWLKNPDIEIPAYASAGILGIGVALSILIFNEGHRTAGWAVFVLLITVLTSLVLARTSLRRESRSSEQDDNLASRIVLGWLYLFLALPLLLGPLMGAFALWIEIYGDPRDIGRVGWFRDWVQVLSFTAIVASCAWLLLLGFHLTFPKILSTIFRPFVQPFSRRTTLVLGSLFVVLSTLSMFAIWNFSYLSYAPGITVAEQDWDKLSPRDFSDMQMEIRQVETRERTKAEGN